MLEKLCERLFSESFFSVFHPCHQIRNELEQHMSCNLKEYKEFIDNEMLLILGQMDKATLIFDHVYLVRIWNHTFTFYVSFFPQAVSLWFALSSIIYC